MNRDYFDEMYAGSADPWGFETRWYEERKRAITLASLPRPRYRRAFEPGCSIGVLTAALAARCDHVVATDVAQAALARARERVAGLPVEVRRWALADPWPEEAYDLIMVSEVAYYLQGAGVDHFAAEAARHLTHDGHLVAVHWRHPVAEYPTSGDEADARVRTASGLAVVAEHVEADFRLTVLGRDGRSVAQQEGLTA